MFCTGLVLYSTYSDRQTQSGDEVQNGAKCAEMINGAARHKSLQIWKERGLVFLYTFTGLLDTDYAFEGAREKYYKQTE